MKLLDRPSSVIEVRELLVGQGGITRHQISYTNTPIFVCKDLFGKYDGKINSLYIDHTEFVGFQIECRDLHKMPREFVRFGASERSIRFDRADNMFLSLGTNQRHIVF